MIVSLGSVANFRVEYEILDVLNFKLFVKLTAMNKLIK